MTFRVGELLINLARVEQKWLKKNTLATPHGWLSSQVPQIVDLWLMLES
jgi:hypothetical protein